MAATLTTTGAPAQHPAPTRRAGGGLRPPTRRRLVGAPHVVAAAECPPRRSSMPVTALVVVAAAVAALVFGFGLYAGSLADSTVPSTTAVVYVAPGESLSDIAARTAPGSDTAAVVDRIRDLNGLADAGVVPGQPLVVPVARR
ncbi:LysM peptidoglycan-binding domain-containing protein [Actinokineospora sp. NPDC004072]